MESGGHMEFLGSMSFVPSLKFLYENHPTSIILLANKSGEKGLLLTRLAVGLRLPVPSCSKPADKPSLNMPSLTAAS